ncbi:27729_t:CDS:2 [Gigaspora margarita]|uniref:27729_t:CDS:1 n=1 Tax=Gigaspora margarita TaxID=4874 RepID=A0ABN7VYQ4_GIGMA|nr:27729_t:CDS:2 [Gigaspora margarita]
MSSIISKRISQDESNNDSQILETNRINSSEDSASDKSISEYSYGKKRKKIKVKKSVGRPEDPVNHEYIKLGVYDKNGHVAMKLSVKKVSNMAKLHAYYVTNACYKLNYVGQNLSESDFLQMMQNYTHLLTSGVAMFEEDIQLYNSEDDFDDLEDDLEDNPITNEVDSNIFEIENRVNLNLALNNTDQPLVLDEVINYGEKDFDVGVLVNQGMQM